ncbi:MAG TPA: MmcQ/YjbR family DNA-binding protein [Candidatus Saccharimonadales bacterium]
MNHKIVEDYILSMPDTVREYPFGEGVAVYKVATRRGAEDAKMFALIAEDSDPLQLSLKCDPQLAVLLREKYETVMAGYHLNKKHWNTMILSGQVPVDEVQDLIRHSYVLVSGITELPEYVSKTPGRPKSK